jgi:hypothetical protein
MTQPAHPADLQSAIAGYMRQRPGTALDLDDIARGAGATRAATSTMLCRIVNGEARDYPITRSGRARYTWMPLDDPAKVARIAQVIMDLTDAAAEVAATLAAQALVAAASSRR